jgi:hypothetical protein
MQAAVAAKNLDQLGLVDAKAGQNSFCWLAIGLPFDVATAQLNVRPIELAARSMSAATENSVAGNPDPAHQWRGRLYSAYPK